MQIISAVVFVLIIKMLQQIAVLMSVGHHTARVYIYKVSILVVCINVSVLYIVPFRGLLSAVINILFNDITLKFRRRI